MIDFSLVDQQIKKHIDYQTGYKKVDEIEKILLFNNLNYIKIYLLKNNHICFVVFYGLEENYINCKIYDNGFDSLFKIYKNIISEGEGPKREKIFNRDYIKYEIFIEIMREWL